MNLKRRRVCGLCSYSRVVPYILFDNVNFKQNEVVGFYGCYAAMKLMSKYNKEKRTMSYQDLVPERKAVDDTIKDLAVVLEEIGWSTPLSAITKEQIQKIIITTLNSYRDHLHEHIGVEDKKVEDFLNVNGVEIPTERYEEVEGRKVKVTGKGKNKKYLEPPYDDEIPWLKP